MGSVTKRLLFLSGWHTRKDMRYRCAIRIRPLPVFLLLLSLALVVPAYAQSSARNERGMVASVHPLATAAGVNALRQGGNAIDAAVAVGLTLGVVDGHNSGIGGGCFFLIHKADGTVIAIDGRETAPAAATRDMFLRDGKADTDLSQHGALASGVPGALAAYVHALTNHGKLKLSEVILPAAKIAEDGYKLTGGAARTLNGLSEHFEKFATSKAVLMKPDAAAWKAGDILLQKDLGRTYRQIAEQGSEWFYNGEFAQATEAWMKANGGLMTAKDFASYQIKLREPVRTMYRGHSIIGFSPPSSGGVHVAQILNILEHFDLKAMGRDSADFIHTVAEAMKLAFADRAYWLGDPDFAKVPRGLVDRDYAKALAARIKMERAIEVPTHGEPPNATSDVFSKHTTHFSTADAEGNWVACTATINTSYGSKVIIPGTGVVLNNEMDDFSAQPGVANFFGLVGAEANAVAPGKRPLSSMSPTIVLRDGKPILAVGAAGGPTIISQTVLAIINTIDFGMEPAEALAHTRFHQQWRPDELRIEEKVSAAVREELARRGHKLKVVDGLGVSQAVAKKGKEFLGAADPRVQGRAEGL